MATQQDTDGHLMVATIKAVIDKQATNDQLAQVLKRGRQGLEAEIASFQATVDQLSPEVREQAQGFLESADQMFGHMTQALQDVDTYLAEGDINLLFGAGSVLRRGADQLNFLFSELRNFVLAVSGPTPIPNLNLLLRAHEVFVPGKDEKGDRLREFVQSERLNSLEALDQLEASPTTPELIALKDCWDQHLRCMNRLFIALEKGDRGAVDAEMENAKTSFTRLFERMPSATMSQRFEGPTPSSQVNLVLSLAEDVARQILSDAPLAEALEAVHEAVTETHRDLEQLLDSDSTSSVMIEEELDLALQAIEYQMEALAEFNEFFENRETLVLRSAQHKLQESAIQLGEALDRLAVLADREGKVVCVRCGHYNLAGRNNCEKCNAPLPNLGQQTSSTFETGESGDLPQEVTPGPVVTSNLLRLYKAVDEVFEGTIDHEAFLAEIDWYQGLIHKYSEYEIDEPNWDALSEEERAQAEEAHKAVEEVQETFAQGVHEMQEALDLFRRYLETLDKADLEEGVKTMDSGARKVAAVGEASSKAQSRQS